MIYEDFRDIMMLISSTVPLNEMFRKVLDELGGEFYANT